MRRRSPAFPFAIALGFAAFLVPFGLCGRARAVLDGIEAETPTNPPPRKASPAPTPTPASPAAPKPSAIPSPTPPASPTARPSVAPPPAAFRPVTPRRLPALALPPLPQPPLSTSASLAVAVHKGILSDRIVAWINNEAIALSELEEALVRYMASGDIPDGPVNEANLRKALDLWTDETLIVLAARKAGLDAANEMVDNRVDRMIKQMETQQGGPAGLDATLARAGKDRDALRGKLRDQMRREYTVARAVGARFALTEADVAKFTAERKAQGNPAETYYLYQVFFPISPDALPERWTRVVNLAHELRMKSAERGDFETAAQSWVQSHADEGASAGPLGAMAPADLLPSLAEAVAKIAPGQSTPPVRTDKGVQVLYLQRKISPRQILYARRYEEERRKYVRELRNAANIQINAPLLGE